MALLVRTVLHRTLAAHMSSLSAPHRGNIQIIFGPMFSGKTTELLRRVRRFEFARQKCLIIKYARDTRYSVESVSTHDQYVVCFVWWWCVRPDLTQLT